jgi:hypothetical protein
VDVAKVRAANLQNGDVQRGPSWLDGTAEAALDGCISGDGEAPLKLTIAAVACAGSGRVACGIPVQHMREDTMTELNLRKKGLRGPAAMLISNLIPANGRLTKLSLAGNRLDEEGTKAICEALEQNKTLKELNLSSNDLGGYWDSWPEEYSYYLQGPKAIADALLVNGALTKLE